MPRSRERERASFRSSAPHVSFVGVEPASSHPPLRLAWRLSRAWIPSACERWSLPNSRKRQIASGESAHRLGLNTHIKTFSRGSTGGLQGLHTHIKPLFSRPTTGEFTCPPKYVRTLKKCHQK
eukprot:6340655-Pyramimonas_sp.AAC.1